MHRLQVFTPALMTLLLAACGGNQDNAEQTTPAGSASTEETLRLQLETAKPGDVIEVPEGRFTFDRSLTLSTNGVTIHGMGMDKTILSFKGQIAGAEGLLVNASDFTIEDLAIEDTIGDALKVNEGKNIVIRRVRTEWTGGPDTKNGAYGIYPVQTENTLIEGSVAIGASDAGIYVGQSRNVVVRDSTARQNVAGIEIENTINADVFNNVATENTGGILVFNMPDLPQAGHSTRVHDNEITNNNTPNFGAPGTAVAGVPAGSGIVINSNDKVEIFSNRIGNNNTANVLISSFFSTTYQSRETAEGFDPYPEDIYIYDNEMGESGTKADRDYLEALRITLYGADGRLPDILWDGVVNTEREGGPAICVKNGESRVLNIDARNEFANPSEDMAAYDCELPRLEAVTLAAQ
ncbi:MAG: parallel beta-helix domain-containing protein [Pseudomonadales bacterium]